MTLSWSDVHQRLSWSSCLLAISGVSLSLLWWLRKRKTTQQDLTKKAILITGCDSGFGYSLALFCHRELGLEVMAGCYKPGGDTQGADSLTQLSGGAIHILDLDVTSEESVSASVKATQRLLGLSQRKLFYVVNNAATLVFAQAEWQPLELARRQFDVNVIGALSVTKAYLPMLRESRGRIINMISFCTYCPLPMLSVYTASKAAMRSLFVCMRMELLHSGVDVILFNPGDHPKETPLCANQEQFYQSHIDQEVERIQDFHTFREYYKKCRSTFCGLFRAPEKLKMLPDAGLYKTFKDIVTAEHPKTEYTNSDVATISFFGLLCNMPDRWSDRMRLKLLGLPKLSQSADKATAS